jgi:outer membrane protein assembly factor BamB
MFTGRILKPQNIHASNYLLYNGATGANQRLVDRCFMNNLQFAICYFKFAIFFFCVSAMAVSAAYSDDWPQWGGDDTRNMVSDEKNLPATFVPGKKRSDGSGIDMQTTKNVKWVARLGTENYSGPVISGGKVFIGANDVNLNDPRYKPTGGGVLLCLDEATGKLLWRLVVPKLESGKRSTDYDNMELGICSTPCVEGNRVYVITNRSEVVCLDTEGMANGNDGPFQDERRYTGALSDAVPGQAPSDADIIWRYDMLSELSVFPHDAASCSVLVYGDLVYVSTGNGVDDGKAPFPMSPSLIALDKRTGRLAAKDDEMIGSRVFHGQWSSPSLGQAGDKALVFYGGGDGVCYAFEALHTVTPKPTFLHKAWSFDCNPPEYRYKDGKSIEYAEGNKLENRGNNDDGTYVGPSEIIGTPVFHNNRVYVATGQDPRHGRGKGVLNCIDAAKIGDVSETAKIWSFQDIDRSMSTPSVAYGLVFIADADGTIYCLDADTGECYWKHDSKSDIWSSTLVADGKVYIGTRRSLLVFAAAKEKKLLGDVRLGSQIRSTPAVADGVLYVASQHYLWAVQKDAKNSDLKGKVLASGDSKPDVAGKSSKQ